MSVAMERIRVPPRPFDPCRSFETWPRDGWKGVIYDVCLKHRVKIADVMSDNRTRLVTACRWEIIWRLRHGTETTRGMSLPKIGQILGLDHSSALYALRRLNGEPPKTIRPFAYQYERHKHRQGELNG